MTTRRDIIKGALKVFFTLFCISLVYLLAFYLFPKFKDHWNDSGIMQATFNAKEFSKNNQIDKNRAVIGDAIIKLEIANTDKSRKKGLSNRDNLPDNSGMLFIFDTDGYHAIWMKEMNFAIDVVWIDRLMKIVDIKENILPSTHPSLHRPKTPALYILELPSGYVKKSGIKITDQVDLV